jgi:brefeldin A-inhibited guanine nucleotide-exchange protein
MFREEARCQNAFLHFAPDTYFVALQVLALELLKILLENSGPVFATSEKFAAAIKQYLCLSLLKNCASAIPHALRLSCSIFLTLISKFRQSLKAEIGVFFPMILLRSIEPQPAGSSPQQPSAPWQPHPVLRTHMFVGS